MELSEDHWLSLLESRKQRNLPPLTDLLLGAIQRQPARSRVGPKAPLQRPTVALMETVRGDANTRRFDGSCRTVRGGAHLETKTA